MIVFLNPMRKYSSEKYNLKFSNPINDHSWSVQRVKLKNSDRMVGIKKSAIYRTAPGTRSDIGYGLLILFFLFVISLQWGKGFANNLYVSNSR